jgi:fructosamine-3-kinase
LTFVKARPSHPDEYPAEAEGLRWLGEPGFLRVPDVIEASAERLVLERIDGDAPLDEEAFGRGLALTHAAGADGFGWHRPIHFRGLTIPNDPAPDFAAFYRECRLRPFPGYDADRVRLEVPEEPPARCHGDLWSGNVLAGPGGQPVLIDPWAHGGHREVDLAIFGGLSARMVAAYEEVAPLADGWRDRLPQWQLFPLLVHAHCFGGGYAEQVRRVTARLV